ncbi:MAG: tetratricopeptide repeat protein [Bacteroidota bacterium]
MKQLYFLWFILFASSGVLNGQETDSPESSDLELVKKQVHYFLNGGDSLLEISTDSAFVLYQVALSISDDNDYREGQAISNLRIGELFNMLQRNQEALQYFAQALNTFQSNKDSTGMADVLLNIGRVYYDFDEYVKSLEYVRSAQETYPKNTAPGKFGHVEHALCDIYHKMGNNDIALRSCIEGLELFSSDDNQRCIVRVKNSLGMIYLEINQLNDARQNFFEALNLAENLGNPKELASSYEKIGEFYLFENRFEESIRYYNNALLINLRREDRSDLARTYLNIGKVNIELNESQNAIRSLQESLEIAEGIGFKDLKARSLLNIGRAHFQIGNSEKAINFMRSALRIGMRINARPILRDCYQNLAIYYNEIGDKENAFLNYNLYVRQNESIFTQQSARRIAEAEALYKVEQKEKEIDLLRKENEIQALKAKERTYIGYGLVTFSVLILIIIAIVYSRYRLKAKANRQLKSQNDEIEKQKNEIEIQKNDIEEKSEELNLINNELTDSIRYARKIQESLFPENKSLKTIFSDSFIFYQPRDIVSGDFYWFEEIGDLVIIATVDCTGHGVPGAFMTVLANSLLNQIVKEGRLTEPNLILTLLDQKVRQSLHQDGSRFDNSNDGMDMALCSINKKDFTLKFTGAQIPLYYSSNGQLEQYKGDRFPIGSKQHEDKEFKTVTIQAEKGDVFYLASDGFQDQFGGEKDKKFMKSTFRKFLGSIHGLPMNKQLDEVTKTFFDWKNGNEQTDDVLVMGVRL